METGTPRQAKRVARSNGEYLGDGSAVPFSFDRVRVGTYSCIVYVFDTTGRVACANVVQLERAPRGANTMSSSRAMGLKARGMTMNTTMNIITVTGKTRR